MPTGLHRAEAISILAESTRSNSGKTMPLIVWNSKYSVGVHEIDEQHKRLIELINELNDAMCLGQGKDIIGRVLEALVLYTQQHFSTEEQLMVQHHYSQFLAHKRAHMDLVDAIQDFQKRFEADEAYLTLDVMTFLKNWLRNHILETDMQLGHELNEKGVS
jgi:hemerythrin